jgi:hypothetical protein
MPSKIQLKLKVTAACLMALWQCGPALSEDQGQKPIAAANEALESLEPFIGQWQTTSVTKYPDGKIIETTGRIETNWILGGYFAHNRVILGTGKQAVETLWLFTYDGPTKVYREWLFSTNKRFAEFIGSWDIENRVVKTRSTKNHHRYRINASSRLIGPDKMVSTIEFDDDRKKWPSEIATATRVKGETETGGPRTPQRFKPARTQLKLLTPMIGHWKVQSKVEPNEQFPQGATINGKWSARWTLDGQFLRTEGVSSFDGKHDSFLAFSTYDVRKRVYRNWSFRSSGTVLATEGRWDAKTKTIIWSYVNPKTKQRTFIYDHLVSADLIESTAQIKTVAGQIKYSQKVKSTRIKKP